MARTATAAVVASLLLLLVVVDDAHAAPKWVELSAGNIETHLSQIFADSLKTPWLLLFTSPSARPALERAIDELDEAEPRRFFYGKVNVDDEAALLRTFNIVQRPSVLVLHETLLREYTGAQNRVKLGEWLDGGYKKTLATDVLKVLPELRARYDAHVARVKEQQAAVAERKRKREEEARAAAENAEAAAAAASSTAQTGGVPLKKKETIEGDTVDEKMTNLKKYMDELAEKMAELERIKHEEEAALERQRELERVRPPKEEAEVLRAQIDYFLRERVDQQAALDAHVAASMTLPEPEDDTPQARRKRKSRQILLEAQLDETDAQLQQLRDRLHEIGEEETPDVRTGDQRHAHALLDAEQRIAAATAGGSGSGNGNGNTQAERQRQRRLIDDEYNEKFPMRLADDRDAPPSSSATAGGINVVDGDGDAADAADDPELARARALELESSVVARQREVMAELSTGGAGAGQRGSRGGVSGSGVGKLPSSAADLKYTPFGMTPKERAALEAARQAEADDSKKSGDVELLPTPPAEPELSPIERAQQMRASVLKAFELKQPEPTPPPPPPPPKAGLKRPTSTNTLVYGQSYTRKNYNQRSIVSMQQGAKRSSYYIDERD